MEERFYSIFPKRVMNLKRPIYGVVNKEGTQFDYSFSPKGIIGSEGHLFVVGETLAINNCPLIWYSPNEYTICYLEETTGRKKSVSYLYIGDKVCSLLGSNENDKRIELNPINFVNDINYCYFNSVFQLLMSCSILNWWLIKRFSRNQSKGTQIYQKFLKEMEKKEKPTLEKIDPKALKTQGVFVGKGDFVKGKMCDASEFLEESVFPILSKGTTPFMSELMSQKSNNFYIKALGNEKYSLIQYLFGNIYKIGRESRRIKVEQLNLTFPLWDLELSQSLSSHLQQFIQKAEIEITYIAHYFVIHRLEQQPGIITDLDIDDFDVSPFLKKDRECSNISTKYRLVAMIIYNKKTMHYYGIYWRKGAYYLLDSLKEGFAGNQRVDNQKIKEEANNATIFLYERKQS